MGSFWNWLVGFFGQAPVIITELKPIVTEGEALIVDLTKVLADLKSNNLVGVVVDAQSVLADAKQFVADVEVVVNQMKAK